MPRVSAIQRQSTFVRDENERSQGELEAQVLETAEQLLSTDSSRLERQRTFVKNSVADCAFPQKLVPEFPLVQDFLTTHRKVERPKDSGGNSNEESEDLDSTLDFARSLMAAR